MVCVKVYPDLSAQIGSPAVYYTLHYAQVRKWPWPVLGLSQHLCGGIM
jgi:hypothetical protein